MTAGADGRAVAPQEPLCLPTGSVRAIVTLSILATVWAQLLRGLATSEVLHDTTLLVFGYYFGTRGASKPRGSAAETPQQGRGSSEPLWLPRGSIRLAIVLGFGLVIWKLSRDGALLGERGPPPILVLIATFFLGHATKTVIAISGRVLGNAILNAFGHALAVTTVSVVAGYCIAVLAGAERAMPIGFEAFFLGIVGFYLGKR